MRRNRILAISGLLVLLAAALPVSAQPVSGDMPPPPPRPHAPGPDPVIGMAGWAIHELDLTEDQRTQLHDIVRGHVEGGLGQRLQELHDARRTLELAVWNPAATEEEIRAASETAAGIELQLAQTRHRLALDFLGILTDQQRETFRQLLETAPPPPQGPGGPGGPHGPDRLGP